MYELSQEHRVNDVLCKLVSSAYTWKKGLLPYTMYLNFGCYSAFTETVLSQTLTTIQMAELKQ